MLQCGTLFEETFEFSPVLTRVEPKRTQSGEGTALHCRFVTVLETEIFPSYMAGTLTHPDGNGAAAEVTALRAEEQRHPPVRRIARLLTQESLDRL